MSSSTNTLQEYLGVATITLNGTSTVALNLLAPGTTTTVSDPVDATATPGDSVTVTNASFEDEPMTIAAVGSAAPGVAGIPLGPSKPVIMLQDAGGDTYFFWPEGQPNIVSAVVMTFTLSSDAGDAIPLCFVAGTPLLTTAGYVKVEDLRVGDYLWDWNKKPVRVVWTGHQRIGNLSDPGRRHLRPITFAPGSFGRDADAPAIRVSGNHRVLHSSPRNALNFGAHTFLVPAKNFLGGDDAYIEDHEDVVDYYHILCERHAVVCAGGIWAETLLLGPMSQSILAADQMAQIDLIACESDIGRQNHLSCFPVLTTSEARLALQGGWHQGVSEERMSLAH